VYLPRDDGWVNEDARTYDPSHDDHGGVERAETSVEGWFFVGGIQFPSRANSRIICKSDSLSLESSE
jgi:hypothetical protein